VAAVTAVVVTDSVVQEMEEDGEDGEDVEGLRAASAASAAMEVEGGEEVLEARVEEREEATCKLSCCDGLSALTCYPRTASRYRSQGPSRSQQARERWS